VQSVFTRTCLVIAALAAVAAAPALAQTTPPLADLARQVATEREAAQRAAKAYTNADLSPDLRPELPAAAPAPPSGTYISKTTGEAVRVEQIVDNSQAMLARNAENMGEAHWRSRAMGLRAERDRVRAQVELLSTAPPARTAGLRQMATRSLERAQTVLAGLEQRWQQFEDSAHYANVPAAWLEPQP
jgi:hypothetical protein